MRPFIAFISRQSDGDFHVSFPDFPDCHSGGKSVTEARLNAESALGLHCRRLNDTGTPIPSPSFLHDLGARDARTDGLLLLIPAPDAT
jgi:predicted RNase H-like HicB family nuclease